MDLKLPNAIATRQDVAHVHRELRIFFDLAMQSVMRHDNPVKYPPISDSLRQLASLNQIDLRDQSACNNLLTELDSVKKKSPSLHVSFPVEPNRDALDRLIDWFRKEIDPIAVISVGLQPSIAAGVIVRTPNHQFDISLRKHLENNKHKLKEAIASV